MDERSRAWFVGVDWASQDHHAVVVDAAGRKLGERGFRHGGEGLAAMAAWITALTEAEPDTVAVAIEAPHGPVVETLMARGFRVHAINPKQLDRFRDRFSPAGAKDDSRDALVLADALRTDPRCFRRLQPLDPLVVELRECSRLLEDLRHDRNRLANRGRELLWRYFPAMLELDDDVAAPWFLDLWERVPTPAKAARVRATTIERLLKRHRIRRFDADARPRPAAPARGRHRRRHRRRRHRPPRGRRRAPQAREPADQGRREAARSVDRATRHRGDRHREHRDDAA